MLTSWCWSGLPLLLHHLTMTLQLQLQLQQQQQRQTWIWIQKKKLNFGITASHCPSLHSVMIYIDYFYNLQRFNSLTYCFKPSTSRLRASIFKWLQTHLLFGSKLKHLGQPHSVSKNLSNKEERRDVWNPKMAIARQRKENLKLSNTHASKCGSSTPKWKFPEREQTSKQRQRKHDAAPRNTTQCLSALHIQR